MGRRSAPTPPSPWRERPGLRRPILPLTKPEYVSAAGRFAPTSAYDRAVALTMREDRWRPVLVRQVLAGAPAGATVVDVGAGTGTLAIALAAARPDVTVVAVDGDAEVLSIARAKDDAERVRWQQGLTGELPLPDDSADAVVMSLLLHHLRPEAKRAALADVVRVLRPGGAVHVADWGRPAAPLTRAGFFVLRVLDGFPNTREHAAGRLPEVLEQAGLAPVRTYKRLPTVWGTLELLRATGGSTAPECQAAHRRARPSGAADAA